MVFSNVSLCCKHGLACAIFRIQENITTLIHIDWLSMHDVLNLNHSVGCVCVTLVCIWLNWRLSRVSDARVTT